MPFDPDTALGGDGDRFPTTRPALHARSLPLDQVIAIYWKPVYKHLRLKWRKSNDDAKDLTQAVFTALIEQDWLGKFDPRQSAFRTYLRMCADALAADQMQAQRRLKRGEGEAPLSLDFDLAERELSFADPRATPDQVFEQEWRRQVFTLAIADLQALCQQSGKAVHFALFTAYDLATANRPTYGELAETHGLPVTQVVNHLAWARRELKRLAALRT